MGWDLFVILYVLCIVWYITKVRYGDMAEAHLWFMFAKPFKFLAECFGTVGYAAEVCGYDAFEKAKLA